MANIKRVSRVFAQLGDAPDAIWIAVGLASGAALEFGFRGFVGRWLGPEMFGTFSLLLAVVAFVGTVATLGMGNMLPRYINVFSAKRPDLADALISGALRVGLLSGLAFGGLLALVPFFIPMPRYQALGLAGLLIPFFVVSELAYATNRAYLLVRRAVIQREIVRRGIPIVILGVVVWVGERASIAGATFIVLAGLLTAIGFGGGILLNKARTSWRGLPVGELAAFLAPLVVTGFLAQANARMDILIGSFNLHPRNLGIYTASLVLPQMLPLTAAVFNFSFLPTASRLVGEGNMTGLRALYWRTMRNMFILGVVPLVVLGIGANRWVVLLFGAEYTTAQPVFELLLVANFLQLIIGPVGMFIVACGHTRLYLIPEGVAFVVGVLAQYVLSRQFGPIGLAGGTLITAGVVVIIRYTILQLVMNKSALISPFVPPDPEIKKAEEDAK